MKLISHYSLHHSFASDQTELPDLRALIAPWVPQRIRRIDRYIELCVAGGLNCVRRPAIARKYRCLSGNSCGRSEFTCRSDGRYFRPARHSHAAAFRQYAGQHRRFLSDPITANQRQYGSGRAGAICRFEAALLHAWLDLQQGRIHTALVGGFDEAALPLAQHARRLGIDAQDEIAEGSHWLLLSTSTENTAAITLGNPIYFF